MTLPYLLPAHVKRYCKLLMWLCLLGAIFHIIIMGFNGGISKIIETNFQGIAEDYRSLIKESDAKNFIVNALGFIFVSNSLLIYFGIANVFRKLSKGEAFSKPAVNAIKLLGISILIYTVINFLTKTLMLLTWTYDNPQGYRVLDLSINGYQLMMFLFGGLFVIIGYIYKEAVIMAEENRLYV